MTTEHSPLHAPTRKRIRFSTNAAHARILMVFSSVVLTLSACGTAYVKDSIKDLSETIDTSFSVAQGVQFHLQATQLLQVGVGSLAGWKAGLKEGHLDTWVEERNEIGISLLYAHELFRQKGQDLIDVRHPFYGDPGYHGDFPEYRLLTDRDLLDLGFSINLVHVGFEFALRTHELADFLTGLVGYDLLRDDAYTPSLEELVQRLRSDDASKRANAADALKRRTGEDMGYVQFTVKSEMTSDQLEASKRWISWLNENNNHQ